MTKEMLDKIIEDYIEQRIKNNTQHLLEFSSVINAVKSYFVNELKTK
jgi:hypothetical protein